MRFRIKAKVVRNEVISETWRWFSSKREAVRYLEDNFDYWLWINFFIEKQGRLKQIGSLTFNQWNEYKRSLNQN